MSLSSADRTPRRVGALQKRAQLPTRFPAYAVAGAGEPKPGLIFGGEGFITSGSGVAACAPVGGPTLGKGSGGVNLPVRTISSTCAPSSVSYSSRQLAIIPSLSRLPRSEEHTSELQSQSNLVCRLLL